MSTESRQTFDAELARRVLERIEATRTDTEPNPDHLVWDQDVWRDKQECGTAMCFAGWVAQLEGTWLMTPQQVAGFDADHTPYGDTLANMVTTRQNETAMSLSWWIRRVEQAYGEPAAADDPQADPDGFRRLAAELVAQHPDDPLLVHVSEWSSERLGLGYDALGLFFSRRTFPQLKAIVDFYAEHGTSNAAAIEHSGHDRVLSRIFG